jgi:predicted ATPase with chaperone activity
MLPPLSEDAVEIVGRLHEAAGLPPPNGRPIRVPHYTVEARVLVGDSPPGDARLATGGALVVLEAQEWRREELAAIRRAWMAPPWPPFLLVATVSPCACNVSPCSCGPKNAELHRRAARPMMPAVDLRVTAPMLSPEAIPGPLRTDWGGLREMVAAALEAQSTRWGPGGGASNASAPEDGVLEATPEWIKTAARILHGENLRLSPGRFDEDTRRAESRRPPAIRTMRVALTVADMFQRPGRIDRWMWGFAAMITRTRI